tara:strand:+ start:1173 stop:1496 length:324 start_codon:yes stop_codon:yes gene_type:complete
MSDEKWNALEKGEIKKFQHNKEKKNEAEYDFKPLGFDGEMWNTMKLDTGLLQQIINDNGVCEAGLYIVDNATFKLVIKKKYKSDKAKSPKPDMPNANDAELDDKVPF